MSGLAFWLGLACLLCWLAVLAGLLAHCFSYETLVKNPPHPISSIRRASGGGYLPLTMYPRVGAP